MLTNAEITKKAREALQGRWVSSVGVVIVATIIQGLALIALELLSRSATGIASSIFVYLFRTAADFLLVTPFTLGLFHFICNTAYGYPAHMADLLQPFGGHKYWRNVMVLIMVDIAYSIVLTICAIPLLVCVLIAFSNTNFTQLLSNEFPLELIDSIIEKPSIIFIPFGGITISLILFAIITTFFGPALDNLYYLLANNEKIGGFKGIRHAYRISRNNKAKYWGLFFRFTGWYMLTLIPIVIFGILWQFVLPAEMIPPAAFAFGFISMAIYLVVMTYSKVSFALLYREMEIKYYNEHPEDPNRYISAEGQE